MLTLGIDPAAQPQNIAACEIRWHQTHAEVVACHNPLNDEQILALIAKADKVGIDVPLEWPTEFVRAVYNIVPDTIERCHPGRRIGQVLVGDRAKRRAAPFVAIRKRRENGGGMSLESG